jgi:hypothetical protein
MSISRENLVNLRIRLLFGFAVVPRFAGLFSFAVVRFALFPALRDN